MSLILGWLWSNKNLVAVGLAALAVGMYILGLKYQISSRDKTIASQSVQIAELNTAMLAEQAHSKLLEERIKNLIADGVRRKKNAELWRKRYESTASDLTNTITSLNGFTPKINESECESSKRLLRKYREGSAYIALATAIRVAP